MPKKILTADKSAMEIISEVIARYRGGPAILDPEIQVIQTLTYFRRMISTHLPMLAEEIKFFRRERDVAQWEYKMKYNDAYKKFRKEGHQAMDSRALAESHCEPLMMKSIEAEGNYKQSDLFFTTTKEVLNSLASDISTLKYEYEKINYATGA